MAKCDCENVKKKNVAKKTTTKKAATKTVATKTEQRVGKQGCTVKNVIIINQCCPSKNGTKKAQKKRNPPKRKPRTPSIPPSQPVMEEIEPVQKKRTSRPRREYPSPSPLVIYSANDWPHRSPTQRNPPKRTVKSIPQNENYTRKRISPPKNPIEVVDYEEDEPYNGKVLERRDREPRESRSKATLTVPEWAKRSRKEKPYDLDTEEADKSKRAVTKPNETISEEPTYYIQKRPKELPSGNGQKVLALPSGEKDDLIDVSDCKNLTGKNKRECERRQRKQRKK